MSHRLLVVFCFLLLIYLPDGKSLSLKSQRVFPRRCFMTQHKRHAIIWFIGSWASKENLDLQLSPPARQMCACLPNLPANLSWIFFSVFVFLFLLVSWKLKVKYRALLVWRCLDGTFHNILRVNRDLKSTKHLLCSVWNIHFMLELALKTKAFRLKSFTYCCSDFGFFVESMNSYVTEDFLERKFLIF